MTKENVDPSKKSSVTVIVCLLFFVVVVLGLLYWKRYVEKPMVTTGPEVVKSPVKEQVVLNYSAMDENKKLGSLMQERKEQYGFDEGLDMIVKPDETIKIGDTTVPMAEILEKIRLKDGEIIERDLTQDLNPEKARQNEEQMEKMLASIEKRFLEFKRSLKNLTPDEKKEILENNKNEYETLKEIVEKYREYKKLVLIIESQNNQIKNGTPVTPEEIENVKSEKEKLANELKKILKIDDKIDAYGIYIVKKNDNIWNIHFNFLKDFFTHRGISISPRSDEPNNKGFSSGIGKILKFSESMVHIYNLREKRLDVDLNLIRPMNKIVIFNMGMVLSLLKEIDYEKVNHIQFDGETLWVPSER